ncbi:hypothetical protein C1Y40_05021 [Mycobacterium talmoniae]|uniref:Uncharacterized protein n=1 Tax=Mycobacterium talmoniae TaxID=1858794 RepID=A0A2S8BDU7_9MYCO|nr:hypothetical protein C1Y40_05021 [Mycobacterium talmoniae]
MSLCSPLAGVVVAGCPRSRSGHTASTTTVATISRYDVVTPMTARVRPGWRWRLIWDSATCPSAAPTGANRNANTTDNVANVLTLPVAADGTSGGGFSVSALTSGA